MTQAQTPETHSIPSGGTASVGRLFFLDASGNRIFSANPDGSDKKVIVTNCRMPDGIVVDVAAGYIYWTNMGIPSKNDGSIERVDLDGGNRKTIVPEGATFTPKQLQKAGGKLYWCDREGMRVMRCNLDGSTIETLLDNSGGGERPGPDETTWCVGIAVDIGRGQIYWTQYGPLKAGKGRIFRAGIEIPKGENETNRSDIEVLFDEMPEPIDLDLDLENRVMYWTDRGDPPRGNTVNRVSMDAKPGQGTPEILVKHLMEGIGLSINVKRNRMFFTDLSGDVYSAALDGSEKKLLLGAQGNITGIAYAEFDSPIEG